MLNAEFIALLNVTEIEASAIAPVRLSLNVSLPAPELLLPPLLHLSFPSAEISQKASVEGQPSVTPSDSSSRLKESRLNLI